MKSPLLFFIRTPKATLQQRNAERGKIPLADQHHTSLRLLAIATSVDDERGLNISTGRRGIGADSDCGNTGDGCDLLPDLLDIQGARFPRLKAAPLGRFVDGQPDAWRRGKFRSLERQRGALAIAADCSLSARSSQP